MELKTSLVNGLRSAGVPFGRLALSRLLEIESKDERTVTVFECETGQRRRVSRALYQIMKKFERPADLTEVISPELLSRVERPLEELVAAGFLVEVDCAPKRLHNHLKPVANTLFRAPARIPGRPDADLAVIGIPFDGGNVIGPGARQGPAELRKHSWQYPYRIDFDTEAPAGWFEVETEKTILEGVTISDWGDVHFTHGEPAEVLFQRAEDVVQATVEQGAFPLLLGGDHSVTYPIVRALQRNRALTVVWLDAHLDHGTLHPGCCHNHKNVVRRILELPNVKQVVNVGYRGYASADGVTTPPKRMDVITASRLRRLGIPSMVDTLPPAQACYISLDIDVLDPSCAAGTATPVPGGLQPQELKELLRRIGEQRHVVGMDIVELNPLKDPSGVTCLLASELLLAALGSALAHRGSYVKSGNKTCINGA